jgi:hypothetical protein
LTPETFDPAKIDLTKISKSEIDAGFFDASKN